MLNHRPATDQEVAASLKSSLLIGSKIRFRGFLVERLCNRAKNGVQHVQHFVGKPLVENGVPFVISRGAKEPLTGTVCTLEDGREFVYDIRIKSEHLK